MSVTVSKRSFARWVPQTYQRPREGDLIYIPFLAQTGELYEIKYVNFSEAFYVLGNKYPYFYKLELEKFKYSQETIDVGIPNVDNTVFEDAYNVSLNFYANENGGNYTLGETVYSVGSSNISGTVAYWNKTENILKITDLLGTVANGATIVGQTSGATYIVSESPDELDNTQIREMYDNKTIQTEADDIVDLSESNPFGTPT
jgi:hypothetical protein